MSLWSWEGTVPVKVGAPHPVGYGWRALRNECRIELVLRNLQQFAAVVVFEVCDPWVCVFCVFK